MENMHTVSVKEAWSQVEREYARNSGRRKEVHMRRR
jgi:hypothetical protein